MFLNRSQHYLVHGPDNALVSPLIQSTVYRSFIATHNGSIHVESAAEMQVVGTSATAAFTLIIRSVKVATVQMLLDIVNAKQWTCLKKLL